MFGTRPEGTRDPAELFDRVRQEYSRGEHRTVPVTFAAQAKAAAPLTLTARDDRGHTVTVQAPPPEAARNRETTEQQLTEQLQKTGGTVFRAKQIQVDLDPGLAVPLSAVNGLRRQALEALTQARTQPPQRPVSPLPPLAVEKGPRRTPAFTLSFRRWEQLSRACLDQGPALVYLPCQELAAHAEELARWTADYPAVSFGAVLPRIVWDRELPRLRQELAAARRAGVTQALVSHIGQLPLVRSLDLTPRADFGLGLTNGLGAEELARLGFASATASFELRLSQVRDLHKPLPTELLVYGRLPLMMMENCILKNRGKGCLCENEPQSLRDRKGEDFPVESAWGCRNELFNAKVLWLADKDDWKRAGLTYARLSFLREDPETCAAVFRAYRTGTGEPPAAFTRGLYYRGVE